MAFIFSFEVGIHFLKAVLPSLTSLQVNQYVDLVQMLPSMQSPVTSYSPSHVRFNHISGTVFSREATTFIADDVQLPW